MAWLWLAAWNQRRISLGTRGSTATAVTATAASIATVSTSGTATATAAAATASAAATSAAPAYGVRNRTRHASGPAASWPAAWGPDVGWSRSGHRWCRRRRRDGYGGWYRRCRWRAGPRGPAVAPGCREPLFCGGAEPVCAWIADVAS